MRKSALLFVVIFVFTITSASAQYPSLTFFGGGNMANTKVDYVTGDANIEDSYKALYGLNIGAFYDYVLNKDKSQEISIESGFIFENKGYHQKPDGTQYNDNKTTLYYLDVPLYLKYRYRFRSRNKLYLGAGPVIGIGLFGNSKIKYPGAEGTTTNSESIKWGNDAQNDDYKRLDYGVSAKLGYLLLNGLNLCVSYDYGLADISAIDTKEEKTRVLRLSLGYTIVYK